MDILNSRVSFFNSITKTEVVQKPYTLEECIEDIREGTYKDLVLKVRKGNGELKKQLPAVAVHGTFRDYREKKDFILATGIIIIDIDDIDEGDNIEEIKEDIMSTYQYVFSTMVSPSGNGVKVLCYVSPDLVTADNYREIGKYLSKDFQGYGKSVDWLSITDCLILTYDPNILVNENAVEATVYLKEATIHKVELEPLDKNQTLWDDAEEFYITVLADNIEEKSSNNFHYLQMAMLDLSKYGFNHPKHDLSFVIDYAEAVHKTSSSNKSRFLELVEICKRYPQTLWPYRTTKNDEDWEDEEPDYDYSEYTLKKPIDNGFKEVSEDSGSNGMVDYTSFLEKVIEIASEGDRVGAEISLKPFADIFRFRGTGILTVTGIPGHGKTEFIDQCIIDLARLYNQETLIAGFEQTPQEHVLKLNQKMIGKNVCCKSYLGEKDNLEELKKVTQYVISKIRHIDTTSVGSEIGSLLKIAAEQIQKSRENNKVGIRYMVIDPYNMLSIKGSRLQGFEKVEEILRRITIFSHQMDVMVILVAHPVKIKKDEKTKQYEVPDFYSVKGSSAFFEMSYHGLVVYREGYLSSDKVLVRVLKVKQANLGKTMEEVHLGYDKQSGRYIPLDEDGNEEKGDHRTKDWLSLVNKEFLD
jgi:hypothetical protein